MPRYEFVEGSSNKFWEIEREGNSFTVRYGKVGTNGQTSTKEFGSEAETKKEYDKMIASKTKKGYREVTSAGGAAPAAGGHSELEQAILADPSSKDAWLVYADWLQSQEDPRGELIAAQAGGKSTQKLLEQHAEAFLGRFAPEDGDLSSYVEISWENGYWRHVKVFCDYDTAESFPEDVDGIGGVLALVLAHPSAKFLRSLSIGLTEGHTDGMAQWQPSLDALAKGGLRPSLRELFVGEFSRGDDTEVSWTDIGSLAKVWAVLPNLERLTVQGAQIELGKIAAPRLRMLRLWSGGLPKEPVQRVAQAKLPELTELELWFGSSSYGAEATSADITPILEGEGFPALRRLGLMNAEFANELPGLVAGSAILPRLQELDLSMGTMTSEGGRALLAHADKLKHLQKLDISRNFVAADVQAELQKALPQIAIGRQQDEDDYVYVSLGE
jgi:uncharacterized protein (TIGR02996 family)